MTYRVRGSPVPGYLRAGQYPNAETASIYLHPPLGYGSDTYRSVEDAISAFNEALTRSTGPMFPSRAFTVVDEDENVVEYLRGVIDD